MDRFILFSLSPVHWLGLLLGVDSVSLAGVGTEREKAKGRKRKLEKGGDDAGVWGALWLVCQQVFIRGPWEILSLLRSPTSWIGRQTSWGGFPSSGKLLETLVLITVPPSAAKAMDGYVKPQIRQVVPE